MLAQALAKSSDDTYAIFVTTDTGLIIKLEELKSVYPNLKLLTVSSPDILLSGLYRVSK